MAQTVALHKILNVMEQEKQTAQLSFQEATAQFEKVAQQLYEQLKRKERAEDKFFTLLENKSAVNQIKEQSNYIERLTKQIIHMQQSVNKARTNMEEKQAHLTEAHVEVKKIESIIEKRKQERITQEKREEMILMDEISVRKYIDSK